MEKMIVAGTPLDRRSKAVFYKDEIINYYNEGYTVRELADAYGVHPNQIRRYLNYDRYLAQCRKDTAKYVAKKTKDRVSKSLFKATNKWSKAIHDQYIAYLVKCKNKFKPNYNKIK